MIMILLFWYFTDIFTELDHLMMSLNSFERIQSVQSLQNKRVQQNYNSREEQEDNTGASTATRGQSLSWSCSSGISLTSLQSWTTS